MRDLQRVVRRKPSLFHFLVGGSAFCAEWEKGLWFCQRRGHDGSFHRLLASERSKRRLLESGSATPGQQGRCERIRKLLAAKSLDALKREERRVLREERLDFRVKLLAALLVVLVSGFLGLWLRQTQETEKAFLRAFRPSINLARGIGEEKETAASLRRAPGIC